MDARRQDLLTSLGLLALRLGAGGLMLTHGWTKVEMVMEGSFDNFANPLGLGKPLSLVLAMLAEFLGALLVVVGLGTRIAAGSVVFTMAVAALLVHGSDPLKVKELALLFLVSFLTLVLTGPGKFSLDAKIGARRGGSR